MWTLESRDIEPEYIERIFCSKCEELQEKMDLCKIEVARFHEYILSISAILRLLVYDNPLYAKVNKNYRIKIEVPQLVMSNWPGVKPNKFASDIHKQYCQPSDQWGWKDCHWYPYTMSAYLNRKLPWFVIYGRMISPGEVISYFSNSLGGVHINDKIIDKHENAAIINEFIIGDKSALQHLLLSRICPDIRRALLPLVIAVIHKNGW